MSSQYYYHLPEERIAIYPAGERSASKLLIFDGNTISSDVFSNISMILPKNSLLLRNSSKVIKARLFLKRQTGAVMEVFCLNFAHTIPGRASAECLIKNVKKLKPGEVLTSEKNHNQQHYSLHAEFSGRKDENSLVEFSWSPDNTDFYSIMDIFGIAPLPPYIKRTAEETDNIRYQTVYADENGSVAAPTAGLHFTPEVENQLRNRNIETEQLILHVGLGTFQPMKSDNLNEHTMHREYFSVHRKTIEKLAGITERNVVCVGTTTLRTLESLYIAAHFPEKIASLNNITIGQWDVLNIKQHYSARRAWEILLSTMDSKNIQTISGNTSLMITPEHWCRTIDYLITNFHQPNSTLLLIVASLIGDAWHDVYRYALDHQFRFLSYGDACLFTNINKK